MSASGSGDGGSGRRPPYLGAKVMPESTIDACPPIAKGLMVACALDGSDLALRSVSDLLRMMSARRGDRAILVHITKAKREEEKNEDDPKGLPPKLIFEDAHRLFKRDSIPCHRLWVEIGVASDHGVGDVLRDVCRTHNVDLLAVGSRGTSAGANFDPRNPAWGSVALSVLDTVPCMTYIAKRGTIHDDDGEKEKQTVMVALDERQLAQDALKVALRVSAAQDTVVAVHYIASQAKSDAWNGIERAAAAKKEFAANAEEAIKTGGRKGRMEVVQFVAGKSAGEVLVEEAYKLEPDLLVVGSDNPSRTHLGSVGRWCIMKSRCAVLIVPDDRALYKLER